MKLRTSVSKRPSGGILEVKGRGAASRQSGNDYVKAGVNASFYAFDIGKVDVVFIL